MKGVAPSAEGVADAAGGTSLSKEEDSGPCTLDSNPVYG